MTDAVRLQPALDDPGLVPRLLADNAPYWPLARYAKSPAERAGAGGGSTSTVVPPWFRRDWAIGGEPLVDGAEELLASKRFEAAAREVFRDDAGVAPEVVIPTTIYVNVMVPTPFPFVAHTDVPVFRGVTREDHPVWLLHQMQSSGLFDDYRVRLATGVMWWFDGRGGDFHHWPNGPAEPAQVESPPFDNVAIVADNERVWHGVAPHGPLDAEFMGGLTVESTLVPIDDGSQQWEVIDDQQRVAAVDTSDLRITMSWKAEVHMTEADREQATSGDDALCLDRVVDVLVTDLRTRGHSVSVPDHPHLDADFIAAVTGAYQHPAPAIVVG